MGGQNEYQKRFKELCEIKKKEILLISQYSDKILYLVEHKEEMVNTDIQGAAEAIIRMVLLDASRL